MNGKDSEVASICSESCDILVVMKPALALTHVFNRLRIETSFIDFFFNSFFLEVLGCFTDGVISLDQDSAAVLKDALLILSSKVQLFLVCDMHNS